VRRHDIAAIPGDGIGLEVTSAALEVLEAAGRAHGFELKVTEHPWGCGHFVETGRMMPEDALDTLRSSDAIFLGAVGRPDVPDHVSLWGLLIPIRRAFRQYVNLRPIRLWPASPRPCATSCPPMSTW
jgi:tartrate dehydrogenase/decarboxylase/D-malate dehydrogenase